MAWAREIEGGTWLPHSLGFSREGLSPNTQGLLPIPAYTGGRVTRWVSSSEECTFGPKLLPSSSFGDPLCRERSIGVHHWGWMENLLIPSIRELAIATHLSLISSLAFINKNEGDIVISCVFANDRLSAQVGEA